MCAGSRYITFFFSLVLDSCRQKDSPPTSEPPDLARPPPRTNISGMLRFGRVTDPSSRVFFVACYLFGYTRLHTFLPFFFHLLMIRHSGRGVVDYIIRYFWGVFFVCAAASPGTPKRGLHCPTGPNAVVWMVTRTSLARRETNGFQTYWQSGTQPTRYLDHGECWNDCGNRSSLPRIQDEV